MCRIKMEKIQRIAAALKKSFKIVIEKIWH